MFDALSFTRPSIATTMPLSVTDYKNIGNEGDNTMKNLKTVNTDSANNI